MKTKFQGCLMAAAVALAAAASAADVYTVTGNVSDLDLTTGAYEPDRLMGPAPGGDPRTLSGTLTHATATLANPFRLIGNTANTATSDKIGQLNLNVTGIDATTPLSFSGYGIFCFDKTYQTDASWSDSYLQTDGQATGYFSELRLANKDITLDRDNPSNLYRLLYGPNQEKRKKDGNNTVSAQCRYLYLGYGDAGSASLTLRNTSLTVYDNFRMGAKATTDSASAAVHGSLVLDHAVLDVYGNRQDFETGTDCLNNSSHLGATNVVVLGAESRLLARRIYQKKAPSLLFTFAGGTLETSWSRSNHDHQLFTSSDNGRIVVTNAPGCDFRFKVSSSEYYPLANSHVSISGDGDFVKLGAGDLRVTEPVRTTGAVRIEEGVLSVSNADALPAVTAISSGACLDICGVRQVVQAPWGEGAVRSSSATPGTLALVSDENMALENVHSNVNLEKLGSGTVTAKGTFGDEITVGEGKLALTALPAVAKGPVRYWRFKVDDIRGTTDMMQFSEVKLYSFGTNVTGAASVTYDTVHNPEKSNGGKPFNDSQQPAKAYDNDTGSKWLDYRAGKQESQEVRDSVWLRFDFGADGALVTGYEWYTANDEPNRDPVSWRLQRSDNGETWEDVDVQKGYDVTTARKALAYRYENTDLAAQVRPLKKLTVAEDASLEIDGIDVVAESITAPEGSITLVNGGTLALLVDVDSGDTRTVQLGDTWLPAGAGVEKTGGGTAKLTGLSGLSGAVVVDDGELRIASAPALGDAKYFRFTVKKTYGGKYLQLSELYLYDSAKNRVNLGLSMAADGSSVGSLAAGSAVLVETYNSYSGSEAPVNLFDGNTGTKFCRKRNLDDAGDESKWCVIVMRLAGDAASVAYYAFRSGGDATPERNPKTWTMEASLDGIEWVIVDERIDETDTTPARDNTDSAYYNVLLGQSSGASVGSAFAAGSTVSVADGARLVLDDDGESVIHGLAIDAAAGAGTIVNFKAAASGVVYLTNVANVSALIESGDLIAFEDCPERPSFSGWTVYVNGRPTSYRVVATDTGLRLAPAGLNIIIR